MRGQDVNIDIKQYKGEDGQTSFTYKLKSSKESPYIRFIAKGLKTKLS